MQRAPADTLTYEQLVCAESGDIIICAFSGIPKSHVVTKRHLDYSV